MPEKMIDKGFGFIHNLKIDTDFSYHLLPTTYLLPLTSYFLLLTSHHLPFTSSALMRRHNFPDFYRSIIRGKRRTSPGEFYSFIEVIGFDQQVSAYDVFAFRERPIHYFSGIGFYHFPMSKKRLASDQFS